MDEKLFTEFQEFLRWRESGGEATPKGGPRLLFRDAWAKYREWGAPAPSGLGRIPSWPTNQETHGKRLLKFFDGMYTDEVTAEMVDKFRAVLATTKHHKRAATIGPSSRNRHIRSLQACLNFCLRRRHITMNPIARLEEEPAPNDRGFAIPDSDFLLLIENAYCPEFRLMLVVYNETGCRRDEIRLLRKTEIDHASRSILLPAERTKTKRARAIPLTAVAWEAIETALRSYDHQRNPYVFPAPAAYMRNAPVSTMTMWRWLDKTAKAANVRGPAGQRVWLHSLRHSLATEAAGLLPDQLGKAMTGHIDQKTWEGYVHLARAPKGREVIRDALNNRRAPEEQEKILRELRGDGRRAPAPAPTPVLSIARKVNPRKP